MNLLMLTSAAKTIVRFKAMLA